MTPARCPAYQQTIQTGVIHCGDNLPYLVSFPAKSVDLIYLDPPFCSQRGYETSGCTFDDRWAEGIPGYVAWMRERVVGLRRVLKDTGSLYLHCDAHASHYLKVMLDDVFGNENFRNEIVWHYRRWTGAARSFLKMHDTVFFYTKTKGYTFNRQFTPYTEASLKRKENYHTRIKGDDVYVTSVDKRGVGENDVWQIPHLNSQSKERCGYPTQKPLALLQRIIQASTDPGDIVLDPFCGSGTTLAAAESLRRRWLGIDMSSAACQLAIERLALLEAARC